MTLPTDLPQATTLPEGYRGPPKRHLRRSHPKRRRRRRRSTQIQRAAFSIPEVMAMTGLGRDKVYGLIRNGDLVARKAGRRTLVTAADLRSFLEALPVVGTVNSAAF
jgi:excisionase family DNA binding protein